MERLLLIADTPLGDTSYANVGKQIMKMLKGKYELYWGGLQYIGKPITLDGYTLLSFNNLQNSAMWLMYYKHFDHILYIRNSWAVGIQGDPFRIVREFSNDIIIYTPVEENLIPKRFFKGLKGYDKEHNYYDRVITMTKTGKEIINNMGVECEYLYHNLDTSKIYQGKSEYYKENNVLNISYSLDYRKNIGTYLLIAKNNPDYVFNFNGLSSYYVIDDYLELYNIKNVKILNRLNNYMSFNFLSNKDISNLYGANNFYMQVSFKEGFDLTSLEALSNGLITFIPDDKLHRELFSDYPNAVFVKGSYNYPSMNQLEYFVPLKNWLKAFDENKERKKMGIIKKDRFSFENVKNKLLKILQGGN